MGLPYKIATLLYCFDPADRVLLLQRAQEPNLGLWSPCGGKLHVETGESPYSCARREADEELGIKIEPSDLHLTGIVSERGYMGNAHWLMFLFEVKKKIETLPPNHREGNFAFFQKEELVGLPMPDTDREQIWPLFWTHRFGFFSAFCECHPDGSYRWIIEESIPGRPA